MAVNITKNSANVETLHVTSMSYGPDAIARMSDGRTAFVMGALKGDVVEAEITKAEKRFVRARTIKLLEPSALRVKVPCPYVQVCGGCPWAGMSQEAQAAAKRQNIVDALVRIGKFSQTEAESLVAPCESPSDAWGYRNKIELAMGRDSRGHVLIGMHQAAEKNLVKVDRCALLEKRFEKLPKAISGALSYASNAHGFELERIGVRASKRTKDLEIALWSEPSAFPRAHVSRVLKDAVAPSSVARVLQKGPAKARRVSKVECLSGAGSWSELLHQNRMRLSAPSFFQVNTKGAELLIELVMEALNPQADDEAMDLYCGAGTFTLPLAQHVSFVSAVEAYGPAVRDLRRNLEAAALDNVEVIGGDAGREFPPTEADIIVVDPPRAGLAPDVIDQLSHQAARAIAYVSCDPATLARDLKRFSELGVFKPVKTTPVDLFPQTFHVESVTQLVRVAAEKNMFLQAVRI